MNLLKLLAMITIITACSKEQQIKSREVLISITNECRAKIKVYDTLDNRQRLMDIYDCSYKSILPIYLDEGNYRIIAENFQGKMVKKNFKKRSFSQTLDIEF